MLCYIVVEMLLIYFNKNDIFVFVDVSQDILTGEDIARVLLEIAVEE